MQVSKLVASVNWQPTYMCRRSPWGDIFTVGSVCWALLHFHYRGMPEFCTTFLSSWILRGLFSLCHPFTGHLIHDLRFIDTIAGLLKWLHYGEVMFTDKIPKIHLIVSGGNDNRWLGRESGGPLSEWKYAPHLGHCAFLFHPQINWHSHGIPEGPDWWPEQISAIQTHLPAERKGARDWGEHFLSCWTVFKWYK